MTLRPAEEVAMEIARNGVEVGSLVLFHQTEAIIHADRIATARRVFEMLADEVERDGIKPLAPHMDNKACAAVHKILTTMHSGMLETANNPTALEALLLKETKR